MPRYHKLFRRSLFRGTNRKALQRRRWGPNFHYSQALANFVYPFFRNKIFIRKSKHRRNARPAWYNSNSHPKHSRSDRCFQCRTGRRKYIASKYLKERRDHYHDLIDLPHYRYYRTRSMERAPSAISMHREPSAISMHSRARQHSPSTPSTISMRRLRLSPRSLSDEPFRLSPPRSSSSSPSSYHSSRDGLGALLNAARESGWRTPSPRYQAISAPRSAASSQKSVTQYERTFKPYGKRKKGVLKPRKLFSPRGEKRKKPPTP